MVIYEQFNDEPASPYDGNYTDDTPCTTFYGSISSNSHCYPQGGASIHGSNDRNDSDGKRMIKIKDVDRLGSAPFKGPGAGMPYLPASANRYHENFLLLDSWSQFAEATLPLKASSLPSNGVNRRQGDGGNGGDICGLPSSASSLFQASVDGRPKEVSRKLIYVNLISLIINLSLAVVAFYFSFVNNSSSTTAFAADCVLDFISSAIVLWRYYGDLNSVYMHAREQIACIYLGALFEISAVGIIIKASTDISSGVGPEEGAAGYDLIYLAVAATFACTILTIVKYSLFRTIRDKSILLDVINTLISTIFAMSIIMSQLLINVDLSFWYMDPILSIVLALFMAGFGLKVIHQNFHILRPGHNGPTGASSLAPWSSLNKSLGSATYSAPLTFATRAGDNGRGQPRPANYDSNLSTSIEHNRALASNWQKADYSSIAFL